MGLLPMSLPVRRGSFPTVGPSSFRSNARRNFLPFLCLVVLVYLYESRLRTLRHELDHALLTKHFVEFDRDVDQPFTTDARAAATVSVSDAGAGVGAGGGRLSLLSLRDMRKRYEKRRRKEIAWSRLNGNQFNSTILVPVDGSSSVSRAPTDDNDELAEEQTGERRISVERSVTVQEVLSVKKLFEGSRDRAAEGRAGADHLGDLTQIRPGMLGWTEEEEQALRADVEDYWPSWWGSVDQVGQSPFDYIPKSRGNEVDGDRQPRLLFLTDYKDYLERMNTHTYEIVDAALRSPSIEVDVWGPGWAGYNRSLPLSRNIKRRQCRLRQLHNIDLEVPHAETGSEAQSSLDGRSRDLELGSGSGLKRRAGNEHFWSEEDCGCPDEETFDVVWTISDIFKQGDPLVDALDCGSLLVQQVGDCHNLNCFKEWYPYANNITLSKYAFELMEMFGYGRINESFPGWEMGLFGHSPDTANEWDYYPTNWNDRVHDVTLFGFDGSFYPIRTTVSDALNAKRPSTSSLVHRHPHPGYNIRIPPEALSDPLETYTIHHEYYETHERIRRDFAQGMRGTKICLFDSSLEKKMIRKYAQALLSGCVIAADLPTEHEQALSSFIIHLDPSWDIERIETELRPYLDRPEELQQMALDGFIYARQHLTTTRKVDDVLRMAEEYRAGARGYDFPSGFSSKCRKYWSDEASYRPPWCP